VRSTAKRFDFYFSTAKAGKLQATRLAEAPRNAWYTKRRGESSERLFLNRFPQFVPASLSTDLPHFSSRGSRALLMLVF